MSRRKRTSWRLPRLITTELLHELDAVPVRIEHVEEPHLVVDLEHRPDLDVVRAEPLRLCLRVVDVDCRDACVLGLAFCERNAHLPPLELGPASVRVQVGLP